MEENKINIINYNDVLEQIKGEENHLLLGNGFNYGLGVNTGYGAIFDEMIEENKGVYKEAKGLVEESNWDLEVFIGNLISDINPDNEFLKKYVENKVKLDFMQATHQIVKSSVKEVYAEKNEGVFLLLNNFSNFFTLNYDSFLYLLLLNFKKSDSIKSKLIALSPSIKFKEEDLDASHNRIYEEIKQIRQGSVSISIDDNLNPTEASIDKVTKTTFTAIIKQYNKSNNKNWSNKVIEKVVNIIMDEEKKNMTLSKVDDGAQLSFFDNEMIFDIESQTQNLFFLHGAFHIFKDGTKIKKITQQSDKALYDRLEQILNDGDKEVVCVFQSENKLEVIETNPYLKKAYNTLSKLKGSLVIIGSSLADNDNHIFEQIEGSDIEKIYISTREKSIKKNFELAEKKFPSKEIQMFDVESISYNLPQEEE